MRHWGISLFLVLFFYGCSEPKQYIPYWESLGLQGQVSSVCESTYSIDYKFGKPSKGSEKKLSIINGYPCVSRTVFFNTKGQVERISTIDYSNIEMEQICRYNRDGTIQQEIATVSLLPDFKNLVLSYTPYGPIIKDSLCTHYDGVLSSVPGEKEYNKILDLDPFCPLVVKDGTRAVFQDTTVVVFIKSRPEQGNISDFIIFDANMNQIHQNAGINGRRITNDDELHQEFDEKGRLVLQDLADGCKKGYKYDEYGNVVIETVYNSKGDPIEISGYEYNNGQLTSSSLMIGTIYNYYYYYDSQGRITRIKLDKIPKEDTPSHTTYTFSYAPNGFIENSKTETEYLSTEYNYTRDDQNRIVSYEKDYWSDASLKNHIQYAVSYIPNSHYSIKNLPQTCFDEYDKVDTINDDHGNWIGKICYKEGEPVIYHERVIEYY